MTDCPNFAATGNLMHCSLAPGLLFPGPAWPNCPCTTCRAEWASPDQPPAAKTPTLVRLTSQFETPPFTATVAQSKGVGFGGAIGLRWWQKPLAFVWAVGRWAFFGFPITAEVVYYRRRAVCGKCDHWTGSGCGVCGCNGVKLRIATERCPLGKW